MHPKKVIPEKLITSPFFQARNLFLVNNFFYRHFATTVSLHFWNLRKKMDRLKPNMTHFEKKNFSPYLAPNQLVKRRYIFCICCFLKFYGCKIIVLLRHFHMVTIDGG
jgi:hypothetical protein